MNAPAALVPPVPLARLAPNQQGPVVAVDWDGLTLPEARRLRELGLDEGVTVQLVRRPGILGGPLACRIGRMQVALRKHVAQAIHIAPQSAAKP
jgi:ferrous iron transport protein A